jgi:DNA-binding response OmpR family regulator
VRINALLNRNAAPTIETKTAISLYIFDATKQTLLFDKKTIALTHRESALLELLLINKDEILDRSTILNTIWGNDDFFNGRSMDVFITKLRKKLDQDQNVKILNIRGFGYKITY